MSFFYLFFALHLILSSYFDVVDTRTRPSNVVNSRYSASPSNFPRGTSLPSMPYGNTTAQSLSLVGMWLEENYSAEYLRRRNMNSKLGEEQKKKGHHVRRSPNFDPNSDKKQKKVKMIMV